MTEFSKAIVTVTLTGNQWFAICAILAKKPMSVLGQATALRAVDQLGAQVLAAAERHKESEVAK